MRRIFEVEFWGLWGVCWGVWVCSVRCGCRDTLYVI
jgi:hypothetical protein